MVDETLRLLDEAVGPGVFVPDGDGVNYTGKTGGRIVTVTRYESIMSVLAIVGYCQITPEVERYVAFSAGGERLSRLGLNTDPPAMTGVHATLGTVVIEPSAVDYWRTIASCIGTARRHAPELAKLGLIDLDDVWGSTPLPTMPSAPANEQSFDDFEAIAVPEWPPNHLYRVPSNPGQYSWVVDDVFIMFSPFPSSDRLGWGINVEAVICTDLAAAPNVMSTITEANATNGQVFRFSCYEEPAQPGRCAVLCSMTLLGEPPTTWHSRAMHKMAVQVHKFAEDWAPRLMAAGGGGSPGYRPDLCPPARRCLPATGTPFDNPLVRDMELASYHSCDGNFQEWLGNNHDAVPAPVLGYLAHLALSRCERAQALDGRDNGWYRLAFNLCDWISDRQEELAAPFRPLAERVDRCTDVYNSAGVRS